MDAIIEPYYTLLPLDQFIPDPANYKEHPANQIHELKTSLLRFGQVKPVVARLVEIGKTGTREFTPVYQLIAGHGITEAARDLVREKGDIPRVAAWIKKWGCIVVPPTFTAEDARAYLVADNELSRHAENDLQQLAALLDEQRNLGADLASLGYTSDELDQLLEGLANELLEEEEKHARSKELAEPEGGQVGAVYNVVVECDSEREQQRAYDLLTSEGFLCHLNTL